MPGYRSLSSVVTGATAESVRAAETLQRRGDLSTAIQLLESALEVAVGERPEAPAWLCGRLAALYRRAGRLDDEVRLLERCRESQTCDELRARFDARLYKARALVSRTPRKESIVLSSVGRVRERRKVARRAARRSHAASAQDRDHPSAAVSP